MSSGGEGTPGGADRPGDPFAVLRSRLMATGIADGEVPDDPFDTFAAWMALAVEAGVHEPDAAILATAGADGRPSARHVLVKQVDATGFRFYTNLTSRKAADVAVNPLVALCYPWNILGRQVRVEGRALVLPDDEADAYFASRPRASQIASVASPQSRPVASRAELEDRVAAVAREVGAGPVRRPERWGGYRLVPDRIEFWQGRPARLHDRLKYRRDLDADLTAGSWTRERLAP